MRLERLLAVITVLILAGCVGGAGMTATPAAVVPSTPGASSNAPATSDNASQFDDASFKADQPGAEEDGAGSDSKTAPTTSAANASAPRFGGGRFLLN